MGQGEGDPEIGLRTREGQGGGEEVTISARLGQSICVGSSLLARIGWVG